MEQADQLRILQLYLRDTGRYAGLLSPGENPVDGRWGNDTRVATLRAMEDGPDSPLLLADYIDAGGRLAVSPANVLAIAEVEAAGAGFEDGYPKLLFEPHRFCKLTKGRFNGLHPAISYPKWGERPYPRAIVDRYAQLLEAVSLDVYSGFAAASYGKFQILGENHEAAGYDNPFAFAFAMAFDERTQLKAFESFIRKSGIIVPLRSGNWVEVARRYNGSAYAKNRYDVKLAQAARKWELKLEGGL
jgi:hypothetical protein